MRMHCWQSVRECEIYDLFPEISKKVRSDNDASFGASFDRSLKSTFQKISKAFHRQRLNLHPQRAGGRLHFFQVGPTNWTQFGRPREDRAWREVRNAGELRKNLFEQLHPFPGQV